MSINLTDELLAKTKKGKIASAKQVFLEGDQENLQQIGEKTNQLEDAIKDITVSGGASTANAVSYNNKTSGMTAITAQGAIDELAAKNKLQDTTIAAKAEKSDVQSSVSELKAKNTSQDTEISKKANSADVTTELNTKLPKDTDSDSSISDGSDEFVVTDSKNKVAFKVDSEGTKARKYNICDGKGNVVKTITKELLDKIEENDIELNTKLPKDTDSDSSISDGSDEFVVTDSKNKVAFKVDSEGTKARKYNICDGKGNVVKTITKELLDKIEENDIELNTKLPKDTDSDSSISDGSDEFVVTDSKNKVAFKVDSEGTKARKYNICDGKGNVVKTITKELLDKIEENDIELNTKLPKDTDSDSSISDGSDEFVVTDSKNKVAFKVDSEGTKASKYNICDEKGNVIKTITKELLDKIEILSQNSDKYGNTCKFQEKKGTYYEISAFSVKSKEQDLKAEFSTNKSKFGERTLHLYVHGKEETELTSRTNRGTVEMSFNTHIAVIESLAFWIYMPTKCFINHRFESIKNPDPVFDFVFSGDNFSESFSMIPQYRLSPSWMLFKVLNKNLRGKEITRVSLSITNNDGNPNIDLWLGCFVADQRFVPTINFNMDSDLGGCVNSKFTDFLESNNIPANIIVRFGSNQMNDGQKIGKRLYFNGIVDVSVRTHVVSIPSDSSQENPENINVQTANYLKKVKAIQYYLNNDVISDGNPIKPIISAQCSHNYIDDVLAHALKTCGYRIIRHSNSYNYCSYIDSESCFIGTIGIGFTSNIHSASDLTDEWKNKIETNFKKYVDDLIEWGMVGSFFTHEVKTREELATNWDSNAIPVDVIEDCINYVLEKEKAGLIQFKTLDNIYYNSVGNDVCNN